MSDYTFWALGESNLTISGGGQLDGVTQGDGSHLVGLTITIDTRDFEQISVSDGGSDIDFDDNDGNQRLDGSQSFDGVSYSDNTRIEAEYQITLRDPNTGIEYDAVAVNVNNSSPSYATIEGLAFVDVFPPSGVALEVVSSAEGPGGSGQPSLPQDDIAAPPCFTPGTLILTPDGERPIEELQVGDLVETQDHGSQPIRWIGETAVGPLRMKHAPSFRPVLIKKDALGPGKPARDMLVSPQHRIMIEGWLAELHFGETQVLVAANHLINDRSIVRATTVTDVTYIHMHFDHHEVVVSNNLESESFNPGPVCIGSIPDGPRQELYALFPELDLHETSPFVAARTMITGREARVFVPGIA
ncbi:hypothetical protein A9Q94_16170 [Rhodobacterales bacterium 56_14_T64]|nr:hypothetical protein A9Q94_16170 [Rhodobacterales bacterium 56_14_T64]